VVLAESGALVGLLWRAQRVQRHLRAEVARLQQATQEEAAALALVASSAPTPEKRLQAVNTSAQCASDNLLFLQDTFSDLATVLAEYATLLQAAKDGRVTTTLIGEVETVVTQAHVSYLFAEARKAIHDALEGIAHIAKTVRQ